MCQPSDGVPAYELTGEDVVYSLQKAANKDTSAYASDYAGMTFASADPYYGHRHPRQAALDRAVLPARRQLFGRLHRVQEGRREARPRRSEDAPGGHRSVHVQGYSPKEKMDLVANDAYFRGKPQLDGVEYRYMADLSSRELGLRSGQLDVIYGLQDGKWVDQMSSAPNVKVDVFGVGEVSTIYFNVTKPPFDNPKVRQAVASALNRDEFLALYGTSVAQKVFSPVPQAFMAGGLTEQELAAQNAGLSVRSDQGQAAADRSRSAAMASRSASSRPSCRSTG